MKISSNKITAIQTDELLNILKKRFDLHKNRHKDLEWNPIQLKLLEQPEKLWSVYQMEATGGEPDVIGYNPKTEEYTFCDCSPESPKGRRSVCYDPSALASRKEYKPAHSALGMAQEMTIELLTEEQYHALQDLGNFDLKTSSWLQTPEDVRKLGGAIFGDKRYESVFIYHNGAESYYAARGFRGILKV